MVLAACTLLNATDDLASGPRTVTLVPPAAGSDAASPDASTREGGTPAEVEPATYIAVVGGEAQGVTSDVYIARVDTDGALSMWSRSPALPFKRSRGGIAFGPAGLLVCGGDGPDGPLKTCSLARREGDRLSSWSDAPALPLEVFRHGCVFAGDRGFVVGGLRGGPVADVLSTRTAARNLSTWTPDRSLPEARAGAVTLSQGKFLYALTGARTMDMNTDDGWVSMLQEDGSLGTWRPVTALGVRTSSAAGAATATQLYISGGYATERYSYVRSAPTQADGTLGPWLPRAPLITGRVGHAMVHTRGHLYVIGGEDETNAPLASVEVTDIAADGTLAPWRETTPLPETRRFVAASALGPP